MEVSHQSGHHHIPLCLAPSAAHPLKHHPSSILLTYLCSICLDYKNIAIPQNEQAVKFMNMMDQKCVILLTKYFMQNPPGQNNQDNFFQHMAKKIDESDSFESFFDENMTISSRTILDEATIDCLLSEIKDVPQKTLCA